MATNVDGSNPLWNEKKLKYKCGCVQIAGKSVCPIHQKEIKEQMIYGNETLDSLNEKEQYKEQNLNE